MNTTKQLFFITLMMLTLSFSTNGWAQKEIDFQKMKVMFEQRRPQLDTMMFGPEKYKLPYLSLKTFATDNIKIASWFIPNSKNKGTILMVHGFDMNKSGMLSRANHFYKLGYSVLLPDLRARGESGGKKANTGATNANDVESVYNFYKQHLSSFGDITFYGYSHGGRAIIFGMHKLKAKESIILESTPYYLMNGFKRQYKINMPMKVYESALQAAMTTISKNRILLLVGDNDTAINEAEGKELIGLSTNKNSYMLLFNETGHSIFYSKQKQKYTEEINTFLTAKL